MNDKYTITLSKKQLEYIQECLETCARMGAGQFDRVLNFSKDRDGKNVHLSWEEKEQIEFILKSKMGLKSNESWGVGFDETIDIIWDMYEVIIHRLSHDGAKEKPGFGVRFDTPMKWAKTEELIKIDRLTK